jgi:hypothetical protein
VQRTCATCPLKLRSDSGTCAGYPLDLRGFPATGATYQGTCAAFRTLAQRSRRLRDVLGNCAATRAFVQSKSPVTAA